MLDPVKRKLRQRALAPAYYIGLVPYKGVVRAGKHPPLIDTRVFDRVQVLLAAHALSGDRSHKHEHYLKGSIFCGDCGSRLTYGRHRSRTGERYEYFSCVGKRKNGRVTCDSAYLPVEKVETAIERYWTAARLEPAERERIREAITTLITARAALADAEVDRHTKRLTELEDNQLKLVHLFYNGSIGEEILKREQEHPDRASPDPADPLRRDGRTP